MSLDFEIRTKELAKESGPGVKQKDSGKWGLVPFTAGMKG